MSENMMKVNYWLVGLGIGSVCGVLFAPKSGQETRQYLAKKTRKEIDYARKKAWNFGTTLKKLLNLPKKGVWRRKDTLLRPLMQAVRPTSARN